MCISNALKESILVVGARDKQVSIYSRPVQTHLFHKASAFQEHADSVSVVRFMQPNESFKYGLVVSAGMDKAIYCQELTEDQPKFILLGHDANVCSLDICQSRMELVSGSWDNTAIVWSEWQLKCKLVGHSGSVWSVCYFSDETIISGSADKTIKIWKDYECVKTIQAHEDCVRCVRRVDSERFISCSNDATIKVWNVNGKLQQTLSGHSSFIYSLAVLTPHQFVSCGEDRRLLVWKQGKVEQEIVFPTRTLWEVASSEDGDVAVASADGKVRVFTRSPERRCSAEEEDSFFRDVSQFEMNQSDVGDNVKTYPSSRLSSPGSENEIIVVSDDSSGSREVYQWTGKEWSLIGNMTSPALEKRTFQGKEYDFVFDVEMEGHSEKLQLPYNSGDNMFTVAMKFIERNNLDSIYLDEIVAFLKKNVPSFNQTINFAKIDKINLPSVMKKINQDFAVHFREDEWKLFPFKQFIDQTQNQSYFAIIDLLRYSVLYNEQIFVQLGNFFETKVFAIGRWEGASLLMVIRLIVNMHAVEKGREILIRHLDELKQFIGALDAIIPDKYRETFDILKDNAGKLIR